METKFPPKPFHTEKSTNLDQWMYCYLCNIISATSIKCDLCQNVVYCSVECQEANYMTHLHECKQEIYHPEKDIMHWFMNYEQLIYVIQSLLYTLEGTTLTIGCAITLTGKCEYKCRKSGVPGLGCDCAGYLCQLKSIERNDAKGLLLNFGVVVDDKIGMKEVIFSYLVNEKLETVGVKQINPSNNSYIYGSLKKLDSSTLIYPINIYVTKEHDSKHAKLSISKFGQL